jgi:hypothetical protein
VQQPDYGKYADDVLAKQMDPKVLDTIRTLEANKDFDNPKYFELLMPNFYAHHICRIPLDQWPEPMTRSFYKINNSLYVTMQGPSEFGIAGNLVNWDRKAQLPLLSIPVLTIGAKYDTMDPEFMKWMSTQVKNAVISIAPNGSHMDMWDDQQVYMNVLIKWLKETNAGEMKFLCKRIRLTANCQTVKLPTEMNWNTILTELTFRTSRSSGAGGQHVNKTETKVEVLFNVNASEGLTEEEKNMIHVRLAARINDEGVLIMSSQKSRSQFSNKEDVIERLRLQIEKALTPKVKRRKTRPSKESIEERLAQKKMNAEKKASRRKPEN